MNCWYLPALLHPLTEEMGVMVTIYQVYCDVLSGKGDKPLSEAGI